MATATTKFRVSTSVGEIVVERRQPTTPSSSLLLLHGLGERRQCFSEALEHPSLQDVDLIMPDLLGFGESGRAPHSDYSFAVQLRCLTEMLTELGIEKTAVLGHSMGGDLAVIAAHQYPAIFTRVVNIEGNLTDEDQFISRTAVDAANNDTFDTWFDASFREEMVRLQWAKKWPSCQRYYDVLGSANRDAFLASAREILNYCGPVRSPSVARIGDLYASLGVPRLFLWGKDSLSEASYNFLKETGLDERGFDNAWHWVMIDQAAECWAEVARFLSKPAS